MITPPAPEKLRAHLLALRPKFEANQVEQALAASQNAGHLLSFTENGMTEPTLYGQKIEDEAAIAAGAAFMRVLQAYMAEVTKFDPSGPYPDAAAHAGNECKGINSDQAEEILERLVEAHGSWLRDQEQPSRTALEDYARFILKAPLEFADANTQDLLTPQEQAQFSAILNKLRQRAAL